MLTDHLDTIVAALVLYEEMTHAVAIPEALEAREALRAVRAQMAREPSEPKESPDSPGWWAFDGYMYWSSSRELRAIVYVSDIGGGELSPSVMMQDKDSHKIVGVEYRSPTVFVGKWHKLTMPWDAPPPAQQQPAMPEPSWASALEALQYIVDRYLDDYGDNYEDHLARWKVASTWLDELQRRVLPQPDWATAPDWAEWWAVHAGGSASWFRTEPIIRIHFWVEGKEGKYSSLGDSSKWVNVPLGIDWRTTLQRRPSREEGEHGEASAEGQGHPRQML